MTPKTTHPWKRNYRIQKPRSVTGATGAILKPGDRVHVEACDGDPEYSYNAKIVELEEAGFLKVVDRFEMKWDVYPWQVTSLEPPEAGEED